MSSESGTAGRKNDGQSAEDGAEERPTYVHRPAEGSTRNGADGTGGTDPAAGAETAAEGDPDGFGRAGWLLVVAVVLSTLVVPGAIYVFPTAPASLGLPFLATYLALPMVPAVLLGLVAVWTMTGARRAE